MAGEGGKGTYSSLFVDLGRRRTSDAVDLQFLRIDHMRRIGSWEPSY